MNRTIQMSNLMRNINHRLPSYKSGLFLRHRWKKSFYKYTSITDKYNCLYQFQRCLFSRCGAWESELTTEFVKDIETFWKPKIAHEIKDAQER